jgi:hypothetical protein
VCAKEGGSWVLDMESFDRLAAFVIVYKKIETELIECREVAFILCVGWVKYTSAQCMYNHV